MATAKAKCPPKLVGGDCPGELRVEQKVRRKVGKPREVDNGQDTGALKVGNARPARCADGRQRDVGDVQIGRAHV